MIVLNLQRIAHQKGIARPYTALRAMGVTHRMASYYMNGHYKLLKLTDLEKICLAWHCTPNDLLQWVKLPANPNLAPGHPLNEIVRTDAEVNVNQMLLKASPEKLKEVQRLLNED